MKSVAREAGEDLVRSDRSERFDLSRLILRQGPTGHRFAAGIEDRSDPLGVGFA